MSLFPSPCPDVYCDVWNIAQCDLVVPDEETSARLQQQRQTLESAVSPTSWKEGHTPSRTRPSRVTVTHIGGLESHKSRLAYHLTSSQVSPQGVVPRFSTSPRLCGFMGVSLKLHDPPITRCIRTSTIELAKRLAGAINEKLTKT